MKCEECELLLAQDKISPEVETHLAGCRNCRALGLELQANAGAMRTLGEEVMPALAMRKSSQWWKWSSAAAALVFTCAGAWWASQPVKPPQIVSIDVKVTGIVPKTEVPFVKSEIPEKIVPAKVPIVPVANTEPLKVKMLTPDPDVVIYWLVDSEGKDPKGD